MREILFRAKGIDNVWRYGDYGHSVEYGDNGGAEHMYQETCTTLHYIVVDGKPYTIQPHTVEQCTGINDCNGIKVFEGDVVDYDNTEFLSTEKIKKCIGEIRFLEGGFWIDCKLAMIPLYSETAKITVVGNIHHRNTIDINNFKL